MKKKLIEQQKRESMIVENFANIFNKIKRPYEPKVINEDMGLGNGINYNEIVAKAIDVIPWDDVSVYDEREARFSRRSYGKCLEYRAVVIFMVDDNEIRISFSRWCEEDPDGPSSGISKTIEVNGEEVIDDISSDLRSKLSNEIEKYDRDMLDNYFDYDDY